MRTAGITIRDASEAEMRQVVAFWKANLLDKKHSGELSEQTVSLFKTEVLGTPSKSWNELCIRFTTFWSGLIELRNQASKHGLLAIKRHNTPSDITNNYQRGGGQNPTGTQNLQRGNPRNTPRQGRPGTQGTHGLGQPIVYTICKSCGNKPDRQVGDKCILGDKAQGIRPNCVYRTARHPDTNLTKSSWKESDMGQFYERLNPKRWTIQAGRKLNTAKNALINMVSHLHQSISTSL